MGFRVPATASQRTQLAAAILLSLATFAFGFVSALPAAGSAVASVAAPGRLLHAGPQLREGRVIQNNVPSEVRRQLFQHTVDAGETGGEQGDGKSAVFSCVLQFPFETVLKAWEGSPPDPKIIKKEVRVKRNGLEEHRMKTLYTQNPLPFLIRKTVRPDHVPSCQRCFSCGVPATLGLANERS